MKIVASIQARLGSSRLPGKVLKDICGKPMLLWHIERIRKSRLLDDIVVATTTNSNDDLIVDFCIQNGINYFRGSENDVLNRITSLIKELNVGIHVELFGDSPLTDPHLIDEVVGFYLKYHKNYDFVSNHLKTTYPPGQEVLVYKGEALIQVEAKVKINDPLREHVSLHITNNRSDFRILNLEAPKHYYFPNIFLEVDTEEDFDFISQIISYFFNRGIKHFSLAQILEFLSSNPDLARSNVNVVRRWKEFRKDDV
jgi:spore coat polysaccharide biosynthesis protein SpsF